eukprot:RCo029265
MICGGLRFSLAISREGLCTWGGNEYGQLGHGDHTNLSQPKVVETLRGKEVFLVSAGMHHSMAMTKEGLYTWGYGASGQLGHDDVSSRELPTVVSSLQGKQIKAISAGGWHSMALAK